MIEKGEEVTSEGWKRGCVSQKSTCVWGKKCVKKGKMGRRTKGKGGMSLAGLNCLNTIQYSFPHRANSWTRVSYYPDMQWQARLKVAEGSVCNLSMKKSDTDTNGRKIRIEAEVAMKI